VERKSKRQKIKAVVRCLEKKKQRAAGSEQQAVSSKRLKNSLQLAVCGKRFKERDKKKKNTC